MQGSLLCETPYSERGDRGDRFMDQRQPMGTMRMDKLGCEFVESQQPESNEFRAGFLTRHQDFKHAGRKYNERAGHTGETPRFARFLARTCRIYRSCSCEGSLGPYPFWDLSRLVTWYRAAAAATAKPASRILMMMTTPLERPMVMKVNDGG